MPDHVITADLLLNVGGHKVSKDIEDAIGSGIKSASDDAKKNVSRAMREAIVSGITTGEAGTAWKNMLKSGVVESQQQFEKVAQKLMAAEKRLSETKDKNLQKRLQKEVKLLSQQAKAAEKEYREKDRVIKREQALLREAAREQRSVSPVGQGLKDRAEGLRGLLSGGPLSGSLAQGAQGLGQRLHTAGEARVQQAQMAGMSGASGKQVSAMAKVGRGLAKVGAGLATVAAAVGAIVVLVKLFADLEAKIKDMNKVLVESAGSADFGLSSAEIRAGKLREALEELRDETTSVNDNFLKFRTTAKEQQQLLSTMNQAGFTYAKMNKEIERHSELVKNYSDITAIAITYGRNLGVNANQVAQTMGDMSVETGQNLDSIAEGFTIVTREALNAGFSTKRFFSTVVEATSGMSFYGVRLEETAKLLGNLGNVMGEVVGADMFKDFAKGGKGYQESLREFLIKDPEKVRKDMDILYQRRVAEYEREYAGQLQGQSIANLIKETGGGSALASRLTQLEIEGQAATDIMQLSKLGAGAATGSSFGDMALARKPGGPALEAALALRTMQGLGGGTLSEVLENARAGGGGEQIAQLLAQAGFSGQGDIDKLIALDERLRGDFDHLQQVALGNREMTERLEKQGYFVDDGKIMKGIMDDSGVIMKEGAEEIGDHIEMLLREPDEDSEALRRQLTEDQQVAMEMSRQVTGLNEIMEQSVTAILNDIYGVLVNIADWLFKDDPQRQAELHLQEMMAKESQEASEKLRELTDAQNALRAKEERGDKLTSAEQFMMNYLSTEIGRATDEAEIAKDAATFAEGFMGSEIGTDINQARGRARAMAGDVYARSDEGKAAFSAADARAKALTGEAAYGSGSRWDQWSRFGGDAAGVLGNVTSFGSGSIEALTKRGLTNLGAQGLATRLGAKGGRAIGLEGFDLTDEQIDALAEASQKGAEDVYAKRGLGAELLNRGSASTQVSLQQQSTREVAKTLQGIEQNTQATAQASKDSSVLGQVLGNLGWGKAKQAKDLILPAGGGRPIITDERDTLMAFQPGGPISKGMGGMSGGGGGATVNIYGGDQKKVYDTVMRVLRSTGNA